MAEEAAAMPIRLRYRLGPSDLVRTLEFHAGVPGLVAWMGGAVTVLAGAALLEREQAAAWLVQGLYWLGALLALLTLAWPAWTAWRWHRAHRFFAPVRLTADAEGLALEAAGGPGRLAWSRFVRHAESPWHFVLYESRDRFVVVPKHAFETLEQLTAFQRALRERVGAPGARPGRSARDGGGDGADPGQPQR